VSKARTATGKIFIVLLAAVAIYALSDPAAATDRAVSIGKSTWSIGANVGNTVSQWVDKNTGEIAKNK
jgi:hypothetical protein